jgi:hypothetical protein
VDTLRATFKGRQVDIRRPMTLTPEERHEYIFTYYLWKFDGRQAVYHALSIDDVRLWSPLTNTWVPASKGIWSVLFNEEDDDVRRLSEAEAWALTTGKR